MRSYQILSKLNKPLTTQNIVTEPGVPPNEFYPAAWSDEPLTSKQVLAGADVPHALPQAVPERSHVAVLDNQVIGQCSLNDTVTYWRHVNQFNIAACNDSTKTFVALHQLAAGIEAKHLDALKADANLSEHNAGIAVLPEYRGHGIGKLMAEKQLMCSAERGKTTLFVETTNQYSFRIMKQLMFSPIAVLPYQELAKELGNANLNHLDDSFTVWCKELKRR